MNSSQRRALENHRQHLADRGLARYEVRGLSRDKGLIRALARRLADDDIAAAKLRDEVARGVKAEPPNGGEIWAALRNSPLAGLDLDVDRELTEGREINL
jgi:hypothetical protein